MYFLFEMGNFYSKCCETAAKKYKKDTVKATQPEQEDQPTRIVTNKGTANETPDKGGESGFRHRTEGNGAVKGQKNRDSDGDKSSVRKHRRRNHSESEDSSDILTSSSSDSSDTDSDDVHRKSSKRVYKNRGGGTTIVSNKTIIAGNKMVIGKNASNVTINIGTNPSNYATNKPKETEISREKPFQSYYSDSEARQEEKRQFVSPWGRNIRPPGGNFIDTREFRLNEYVFESKVLTDAASWVCKIHSPGGSGTGFRVGSKYVMTASHVVKFILDYGYQQVGQPQQNPFERLQDPAVYAVFEYITEGQQISERHKFHFKDIVHFSDDETDTAILELEDNRVGTPMPFSFTYFSLPHLNKRFQFIGHPGGERMQINHVDRIIDMNSTATHKDIVDVKQRSQHHIGRDYEFQPHHILTNPHRYLFHCKFSKGASGSPGVIVLPDGRVVVVTMLLCGLPDWYYDRSVPEHFKNSWPKEYCIEQGVNLKSVYERMLTQTPDLCREIFIGHNDSIPAPNI